MVAIHDHPHVSIPCVVQDKLFNIFSLWSYSVNEEIKSNVIIILLLFSMNRQQSSSSIPIYLFLLRTSPHIIIVINLPYFYGWSLRHKLHIITHLFSVLFCRPSSRRLSFFKIIIYSDFLLKKLIALLINLIPLLACDKHFILCNENWRKLLKSVWLVSC